MTAKLTVTITKVSGNITARQGRVNDLEDPAGPTNLHFNTQGKATVELDMNERHSLFWRVFGAQGTKYKLGLKSDKGSVVMRGNNPYEGKIAVGYSIDAGHLYFRIRG